MPEIYRTLARIEEHQAYLKAEPHPMKGIQKTRDEAWQNNPADGAALLPNDVRAVPGGVIMSRLRGEPSYENLFVAFCDYFHTPGNWTWNGGTATPAAAAILDGDGAAKQGQCMALVNALRLLATTRKPYGTGYPATQLPAPVTYTGRYKLGFISQHPANGILNLSANIWPPGNAMPTLATPMSPLYAWQNHKVQEFKGKFFDPSYRNIYNQLKDMVTYHMRPSQKSQFIPPNVMVADDNSGSPVYFIELSLSALKNYNRQPPGYIGPYARLSDVPEGFLVKKWPGGAC